MRRLLSAATCLALAGVLPAYAQDDVRVRERETTTEVRRVSVLIGSKVTVEREDSFGKVVDVVINEHGCIDYVIVSYDEDLVAVPWGVVNFEAREKVVRIDVRVTRERLRSVTFREGRWPDFRSDRWRTSAREVWGERAFRRERDSGTDRPA